MPTIEKMPLAGAQVFLEHISGNLYSLTRDDFTDEHGQWYLATIMKERIKQQLKHCSVGQNTISVETDEGEFLDGSLSLKDIRPQDIKVIKTIVAELNKEIPTKTALKEFIALKKQQDALRENSKADQREAHADAELAKKLKPLLSKIEGFYKDKTEAFLSKDQQAELLELITQGVKVAQGRSIP